VNVRPVTKIGLINLRTIVSDLRPLFRPSPNNVMQRNVLLTQELTYSSVSGCDGAIEIPEPAAVALARVGDMTPNFAGGRLWRRSPLPLRRDTDRKEAVGTGCRLALLERFVSAFIYPIGNFCVVTLS
jgi:hypothetical protein